MARFAAGSNRLPVSTRHWRRHRRQCRGYPHNLAVWRQQAISADRRTRAPAAQPCIGRLVQSPCATQRRKNHMSKESNKEMTRHVTIGK